MKWARIPDVNEPKRPPDGEVSGFSFWLGQEGEGFYSEDDPDLDDDAQASFRFTDGDGEMREQEWGG